MYWWLVLKIANSMVVFFFACFAQWIIGVAIHRGGGLVISQTLDMAQGMKIPKYSEQFL